MQKPTCSIAYNLNVGGVNMADQQPDGIEVLRKSYKWYKKLFLRLVIQCAFMFRQVVQIERWERCCSTLFVWLYVHSSSSMPQDWK